VAVYESLITECVLTMQEGAEERETFVESEEEEEDLDDSDTELSEQQSKDPIIQAYAQARKQRAEKISSTCKCNISLFSECAHFCKLYTYYSFVIKFYCIDCTKESDAVS
jgi:predicted oxidoreductase